MFGIFFVSSCVMLRGGEHGQLMAQSRLPYYILILISRPQNEVINIKRSFARHDLNILSIRKPKLIEKIINRGTGDVLNDLKTITDPNQFNKDGPPSLTSSG